MATPAVTHVRRSMRTAASVILGFAHSTPKGGGPGTGKSNNSFTVGESSSLRNTVIKIIVANAQPQDENAQERKMIIKSSFWLMRIEGLPVEDVLGAYLSALEAYCPGLWTIPAATSALTKQNFQLDLLPFDLNNDSLKPHLRMTLDEFTTLWGLDLSWHQLSIGLGLLMLLGFKRLSDLSYDEWMRRRLIALTNTAGLGQMDFFTESSVPIKEYCRYIHSFISPRASLRIILFQRIVSGSGKSGAYGGVFDMCLKLISWTDMTTFSLIDKYIVRRNPILLSWPKISGHIDHLLKVYEYMATFSEGQQPYVKIENHPGCEILNSREMTLLGAIASKIGCQEESSLTNYQQGAITGEIARIAEAAVEVVESMHQFMTKAVEEELEAKYANAEAVSELLTTPIGQMTPSSSMPGFT
jgi:hypothetical protein